MRRRRSPAWDEDRVVDEPLGPARSLMNGVFLGALGWMVLGVAVYGLVRLFS